MKVNELGWMNDKLQRKGGKILIIQTAFLGDVILLTPLIGALRKRYPDCELTAVTNKVWSDVISNLVDDVIPIDKRSIKANPQEWKGLINTIRAEHFDLALIPHRSFRSGWLAKQAGIPQRVGFDRGGGRYLHTIRVDYPQFEYEGVRNLKLLVPLTDSRIIMKPKLKPSPDDFELVQSLISDRKLHKTKYIVTAPGSVWKTKRWLINHYRSLINTIKDNHDINTLLLGSNDDKELCNSIAVKKNHSFAGDLTPLQSCVLIENSEFVISGDTAPAHMATAMNKRQVVILGSTTPRFGFVGADDNIRCIGLDLWCRPCTNHGRNSCPLIKGSLRCMSDISPSDIYNLVKDWLQ